MSADDKIGIWLLFLAILNISNGWLRSYYAKRSLKEFPPERVPEIVQLLKDDKYIGALKRVREIAFWELRRAKDYVEELKQQQTAEK